MAANGLFFSLLVSSLPFPPLSLSPHPTLFFLEVMFSFSVLEKFQTFEGKDGKVIFQITRKRKIDVVFMEAAELNLPGVFLVLGSIWGLSLHLQHINIRLKQVLPQSLKALITQDLEITGWIFLSEKIIQNNQGKVCSERCSFSFIYNSLQIGNDLNGLNIYMVCSLYGMLCLQSIQNVFVKK